MSRLGVGVAALLCAIAIGTALLVDAPDVARELRRATAALGPWTYAIVAVLVALEAAAVLGLVSPGEAALAVGGAAAAHGAIALAPLIAAAWAAGVAGDAVGHAVGRRHGRAVMLRSGPRIGLSAERLARLEAAIRRWGGAALVLGRFVGLVRAVAPLLAGASGVPLRRLVGFSIVGAGVWSSVSIVGGYLFAASLESHLDAVGNVALGVAGGLMLAWLLRGGLWPRVRASAGR